MVEQWSPKPKVVSSNLTTRANKFRKRKMDVKAYLKDTYNEFMFKTTWPTFSELQKNTVLVGVSTIVFALIIFLMDKSLSFILETIYELFA